MSGYEIARWRAYFEAKDRSLEKIDVLFARLYAIAYGAIGADVKTEDLFIDWDAKPVKIDQKTMMMMLAKALGAEVRYVNG